MVYDINKLYCCTYYLTIMEKKYFFIFRWGTHLYTSLFPSVRPCVRASVCLCVRASVRPCVRASVCPSFCRKFFKNVFSQEPFYIFLWNFVWTYKTIRAIILQNYMIDQSLVSMETAQNHPKLPTITKTAFSQQPYVILLWNFVSPYSTIRSTIWQGFFISHILVAMETA